PAYPTAQLSRAPSRSRARARPGRHRPTRSRLERSRPRSPAVVPSHAGRPRVPACRTTRQRSSVILSSGFFVGGAGGGNRTPPFSRGGDERRSEEHTSELQSRVDLVCRLLLEKKKYNSNNSKATNIAPAPPILINTTRPLGQNTKVHHYKPFSKVKHDN